MVVCLLALKQKSFNYDKHKMCKQNQEGVTEIQNCM